MKTFIIHLSKIKPSLDSALVLRNKLNSFGMDAELFEGSYGDVVMKQYEQQNRKHHPWSFKHGPEHRLSADYIKQQQQNAGVIGCFDSHYRLWQKCCELQEPILVMEDDADAIRPYIPVEFDDVLIVAFSHNKKRKKYLHYIYESEGEPEAKPYKQASMPGTAGYVIKPHAAKILVDEYKNSFLPADNAMNYHLVKLQVHGYAMGEDNKREKYNGKISLVRRRW